MELVAAYTSLAVTLGLVVTRPRVAPGHRIGPAPDALAGVLIMVFGHVVSLKDATGAALLLARPLLGIVALMVMAAMKLSTSSIDFSTFHTTQKTMASTFTGTVSRVSVDSAETLATRTR